MMNSEAQKFAMTGKHPVQVYGHTAQGASTAQVNAMCKNLKMGTVMGKTQACAISTVAWFLCRGFDVGTRRRVHKVWEENSPTLAKDHRRWNQATHPIAATICSVLEAGTPGFWQAPEANATLDGALFNKAKIIEKFLHGYGHPSVGEQRLRARARTRPPCPCAHLLFCGNARNVVEVGSPKSYASELPQDQGRAADQRGQTPASAHRTLIQPILPRRPSGTVNLGQAIRRRLPAIRRRPQRADDRGGPSVDDRGVPLLWGPPAVGSAQADDHHGPSQTATTGHPRKQTTTTGHPRKQTTTTGHPRMQTTTTGPIRARRRPPRAPSAHADDHHGPHPRTQTTTTGPIRARRRPPRAPSAHADDHHGPSAHADDHHGPSAHADDHHGPSARRRPPRAIRTQTTTLVNWH